MLFSLLLTSRRSLPIAHAPSYCEPILDLRTVRSVYWTPLANQILLFTCHRVIATTWRQLRHHILVFFFGFLRRQGPAHTRLCSSSHAHLPSTLGGPDVPRMCICVLFRVGFCNSTHVCSDFCAFEFATMCCLQLLCCFANVHLLQLPVRIRRLLLPILHRRADAPSASHLSHPARI